MTYRKFLLVRMGGVLALLSVFFLVFERHLWLWACVGLAVGVMLLVASSRMER
jgi:hypothetical protein